MVEAVARLPRNLSPLARFVRECRRRRGVSLREYGERYDVSAQAVQKWEKGGKISDEVLQRIAVDEGRDWLELKYGPRQQQEVKVPVPDQATIEAVKQVLEALPPAHQAVWIAIGKCLVGHFGAGKVSHIKYRRKPNK